MQSCNLSVRGGLRDQHSTQFTVETQAEGEAGSTPEPDMGLDLGSPGSCPGLKAALNR